MWRSIRAPRGGRRGLATKVRHINEGIAQGYYQGRSPFVTRDGLEYAKQWKFQVSNSVLQGATVWEVETSSSGGGSDLGNASCKSSPNSESIGTGSDLGGGSCKSSTSKASGPFGYPTGSSSSSVVPQAKSSGTHQLGARAKPAAKAIERILRPRLYLPDTVVWFDRGNKAEDIGSGPDPVGVNFKEVSNLQCVSRLQNIRQSGLSGISKVHSFS